MLSFKKKTLDEITGDTKARYCQRLNTSKIKTSKGIRHWLHVLFYINQNKSRLQCSNYLTILVTISIVTPDEANEIKIIAYELFKKTANNISVCFGQKE